jgi:transcriptional regulator with XRE-family HTH domain
LREAAGVSHAELARRAGVPVSTLRHWENDQGFPGVPAFRRLAEALGVPAERLAAGVDDPAEDEAEPVQKQPHRTPKRRGAVAGVTAGPGKPLGMFKRRGERLGGANY